MAEGIGLLNQRMVSIPWVRIPFPPKNTHGGVVQLVERMLCKHNVTGSSPVTSTINIGDQT